MASTGIPLLESRLILSGLGLADRRTPAEMLASLRDEPVARPVIPTEQQTDHDRGRVLTLFQQHYEYITTGSGRVNRWTA